MGVAQMCKAPTAWIPPTAVQGVFSLPFGLGVAHYDQPPPDELPDVEALLAADAVRFANQLQAWIQVGAAGSPRRACRNRGGCDPRPCGCSPAG